MSMVQKAFVKIRDGAVSLISSLTNRRNALNNNVIAEWKMPYPMMRALYKNGVASKIISVKSDYALGNKAIQFENKTDEEWYNDHLAKIVKKSLKDALAFGRAIIVIVEINKDLEQPLDPEFYKGNYKLVAFSGDVVTVYGASYNIMDEFYMRPKFYNARGFSYHHSRVIDFKYQEPPFFDLPEYMYGGVSEFQIINNELVANAITLRAGASIVEKNSTLFYKILGLKDLMEQEKEDQVVDYVMNMENGRSIYGAGLIDDEDEVTTVNQSLTDFDKVDNSNLRKLAMVTNIPMPILVGENAQGMNANGKNEMDIFWWMIKNIQTHYAEPPLTQIMRLFGRGRISFTKQNSLTPQEEIEFESKAIENASKLFAMGEDPVAYLESKNIKVKKDIFSRFIEPEE